MTSGSEIAAKGHREADEGHGVLASATFISRVRRDAGGRLTGVVERVATSEKGRVQGPDRRAEVIQRMLAPPTAPPAGGEAGG